MHWFRMATRKCLVHWVIYLRMVRTFCVNPVTLNFIVCETDIKATLLLFQEGCILKKSRVEGARTLSGSTKSALIAQMTFPESVQELALMNCM